MKISELIRLAAERIAEDGDIEIEPVRIKSIKKESTIEIDDGSSIDWMSSSEPARPFTEWSREDWRDWEQKWATT